MNINVKRTHKKSVGERENITCKQIRREASEKFSHSIHIHVLVSAAVIKHRARQVSNIV